MVLIHVNYERKPDHRRQNPVKCSMYYGAETSKGIILPTRKHLHKALRVTVAMILFNM